VVILLEKLCRYGEQTLKNIIVTEVLFFLFPFPLVLFSLVNKKFSKLLNYLKAFINKKLALALYKYYILWKSFGFVEKK